MTTQRKSKKRSRTSRNNYKNGASIERKIRDAMWRQPGVRLVVRAAGSKTPIPKDVEAAVWRGRGPKVDLVAMATYGPIYVQCKPRPGDVPAEDRLKLANLALETRGIAYEAWWDKGAKFGLIARSLFWRGGPNRDHWENTRERETEARAS